MRRLTFAIVVVAISILGVIFTVQQSHASDLVPNITSPSAIVIDARTGEVLWSKNADEARPMASTTKIMTAIIALEKGILDETVTVKKVADLKKVNGFGLVAGESLNLRDMLYLLLLNSANDAAIVIANHISGSESEFVSIMNKKATEIGAKNTLYANSHGLDRGRHYSTAYDLALIARHAMKNKEFAGIVAAKERRIGRASPRATNSTVNRNKLLWTYKGINGIKTGHTGKAGYCLVASAKRDNVFLISVVLGAGSQETVFDESTAVLDYGFGLYEKKAVIEKGVVYKTITMKYDQQVDLVAVSNVETLVRRSMKTDIKITSKAKIKLPVKKGDILGKITVLQAGREIASAGLIAKKDVKPFTLKQIIGFYFNHLWEILG